MVRKFVLLLLWELSLNSELHTCKAGTLLTTQATPPVHFALILEMGSCELSAQLLVNYFCFSLIIQTFSLPGTGAPT
jgi:hypothetical protein